MSPRWTPTVALLALLTSSAALVGQEPGVRSGEACLSGGTDPGPFLQGRVLDAGTGVTLPGASVELALRDQAGAPQSFRTETDAGGGYVFCGLPVDTDLRLAASYRGRTSRELEVSVEGGGTRRDVRVDLGESAHLLFTVRRAEDGAPVEHAAITLEPIGLLGLTDDRGQGQFPRVPPGTWWLTIRRIGLGEQSDSLVVREGADAELEVRLPTRAIPMEPLEVTVTGRSARLTEVGFYERRASDRGGFFLTADSVERRGFTRVSDIFDFVPGVRVRTADNCRSVYVDGRTVRIPIRLRRVRDPRSTPGSGARYPTMQYYTPFPLDHWTPEEVAGVEVFRQGEYPAKYDDYVGGIEPGRNCAIVLIWTKR